MKPGRRPIVAAARVSAAALALCAACGGGRTTAATQPTSAHFDAAASDPKAVALADQVLANLGGAAAWDAVKQIQWEQRYSRDGKLVGLFRHAWDRWNGRHRFEEINIASMEKAQREGKPDDIQVSVAMYDLFDHAGKGAATFDSKTVDTATRDQLVKSAYDSFRSDSYRLAAIFKLKDPGVKLALKSPIQPVKEHCKPGCDVIEVTFAPEVGSDTWLISVNSQSRMPELLEKQMPQGRLGFALSGWVQVGGLKFATRFDNLGMSETFEVRDLKIGDPEDALYIPTITE
ncbi:MAG TPA: hypothetical protein VK698_31580 [Kofleriaceae bacterium]|nr:hypothetical protein [Kofleriaceae bacterium]